jgi:tRNA threonylcarbamoyladenosine biosynthesis protein TsaE
MILGDDAETGELGQHLASLVRAGDIIALSGPLGVGKTALARAILAGLGYVGEVPSPTFAIVQPYEGLDPPVWHADLYRIESSSELEEIGLDMVHHGILLVEWPEHAGEGVFADALWLRLEFAEDGARALTAEVPPSWEARWQR